MIKRTAFAFVIWGLFAVWPSLGQTIVPGAPAFCADKTSKLYCQLPTLFDEANPNPFTAITESFASQLTQVPLASPASGIIYIYDPAIKIPVKAGQETYGPVLTDRGDTMGRHKLFLAFTFQHFTFSSIDGIGLGNIPVVFNVCTVTGQCAPIGTIDRVTPTVSQFAAFGTFGLTSTFDLSVAIPINNVSFGSAAVSCTICNGPIDSSVPPNGVQYVFQPALSYGSKVGIGDVVLRAKWRVLQKGKYKLALGADLRFPSGDALNFLGTGAWGVKPFAAFSRGGKFSPHANVGYQWNGDSVLGGQVAGTKGKLPDNLLYSAGFDAALFKKLTIAGDFLGQYVRDQLRLEPIMTDGVPDVATVNGSFNTAAGSVGFKLSLVKNLLITGNVLLRFDHNGLRYNPVPLAGISYTF